MSRIVLNEELQTDYERLFSACDIRAERMAEVDVLAEGLLADRDRYRLASEQIGVPWFVVAVLHYADTACDFGVHLHNGDPLTGRTRHLPDGRPLRGEPPFAWEDSTVDALCLHHLDQWGDWSIAGTLFKLESHGGWGYRLHHPDVLSPYLWNYSTYYSQGKYVADDTWQETAIAQRCGVAVLLRRLAERGLIEFTGTSERAVWPLHKNGNFALGGSVAAIFEYPARDLRESGRFGRTSNLRGIPQIDRALSAGRPARLRGCTKAAIPR